MQDSRNLAYKKYALKKYVKYSSNNKNTETNKTTASKEPTIVNNAREKHYCKEELFLLGFNAFEIHKFFKPIRANLWKLKNFILINNEIIETLEELSLELKKKTLFAS